MIRRDEIRPAGVAGLFYPADKETLERDISLFLENAPLLSLPTPIRAMIVPHAGYMYSGGVAAHAYRQVVDKKYEVVVLIGPSHRDFFEFISIFPGKALQTPLGELPLDNRLIDELVSLHPDIRLSRRGFSSNEHSLEVQLPFLKWMRAEAGVVPLIMGQQSAELIRILRQALVKVLKNRNFLAIASSDLSHFYADAKARELDRVVITDVSDFAPDRLLDDIASRKCEMCGYGPAITAMMVARDCGAKKGQVLLYRNSGDVSGNKREVVGYLSGIFY